MQHTFIIAYAEVRTLAQKSHLSATQCNSARQQTIATAERFNDKKLNYMRGNVSHVDSTTSCLKPRHFALKFTLLDMPVVNCLNLNTARRYIEPARTLDFEGRNIGFGKVSGCFRTLSGAQTYCVIRSYCATMQKQGANVFESLVSAFKGATPQPCFG